MANTVASSGQHGVTQRWTHHSAKVDTAARNGQHGVQERWTRSQRTVDTVWGGCGGGSG
ncbi:hypothetical protein [Kibdelosporangium philippinense]|uniref:hypothetical protein n=1 Tax=Kibdelosporangium philippinense TaxID=211113 RepID=UPI0036176A2F